MDMLSCASPNGTSLVHIHSEGYPTLTVDLRSLVPRPDERDTSAALIRGVAVSLSDLGFHPQGFDAYEVLVGTIFNTFFCEGTLSPVQLAQIG